MIVKCSTVMEREDKKVIEAVRAIVERGNNAEVKKSRDGTLKVLEVKKHIAIG